MTVYLDGDFRCHLENDGTMQEAETAFFDGKCRRFIEGYRFVPVGEVWIRGDGAVFAGEMIVPWKDHSLLAEFQAQYAESQEQIARLEARAADQEAALTAIYTGVME